MSSESSASPPQLVYKPVVQYQPSYRLSKLLPLSGSQTVNINSGGATSECIFEIPTKPFNLSECILSYQRNFAGQGTNYAWTFADTLGELQQIQLYTRSGKYLCDLNNAHNYLKVCRKIVVSQDDFISADPKHSLYPCNQVPQAGQRHDNTANSVAVLEPQYLKVFPSLGNTTGTSVDYVQLRLGHIVDTIFSYDKDLIFPEVLVLRLVFSATKLGFASPSGTNPNLFDATPATRNTVLGNGTGAGAISGYPCILTNMCLYMAVEQNPKIQADLVGQLQSGGMKLMVPFVHTYKTTPGAQASQTVSVRLNRGHGAVCKRIVHSIFDSAETLNNAFNNSNIGANSDTALKVTNYYTMLNNERKQELIPTCTLNAGEDYLLHTHLLQRSIIMNNNVYSYNWFHCESFDQVKNSSEREMDLLDDNNANGLDLSIEQKWDFYGSNMIQQAFNHYTFVICMKELSIAPAMIDIV